jgi:hypothetical protein
MDQTIYEVWQEREPFSNASTRQIVDRDFSILLPIVITHPEIDDIQKVLEMRTHLWSFDTGFNGYCLVRSEALHSMYGLHAKPSNGRNTTASSLKLPFYGTSSLGSQQIGDTKVELYGAAIWLSHGDSAQLLQTTTSLMVMPNRTRKLIGQLALLSSDLILELDYLNGEPTSSIWRLKNN